MSPERSTNTTRDPVSSSGFRKETERERHFDWPLCYEAENEILRLIQDVTAKNRFCRHLADRMLRETGTLLIDWTDHLGAGPGVEEALRPFGYLHDESAEVPPSHRALGHPKAMLPRVLIERDGTRGAGVTTLALKVDDLGDFLSAHGFSKEPEGEPFGRYRRVRVAEEHGTCVEAVERRGYRGFLTAPNEAVPLEVRLRAMELWKTRPRRSGSEEEAYERCLLQLDKIIGMVGADAACHIVFAEERRYWEGRNRAARVQKFAQDRLGLGWANHDHHTFRSSRRHFLDLMRFLEKLGFERRERYYAGAEAGWGAQILEQPVEGIVTFCDVDLRPEETEMDFSRHPLPEVDRLGTIGLWIGLHGESFLQAGMHHLECRFDFERTRERLATEGIDTMKPFSDFPFLKQAFTEGERWPVTAERIDRLLHTGRITAEQADRFGKEGALGSHLENLQRKGGFKGFNQTSVSAIIAATDPRLVEPGVRPCMQGPGQG